MKNINTDIFKPIIKTIDRVIFGLEETDDKKEPPKVEQWITKEDQDDKIVVKSIN
jgi:hypothetical protein